VPSSAGEPKAVPEPRVPADVYDEEYYVECCLGGREWRDSDGAGMVPLFDGLLDRAQLRAGELLVDLGTGRGELIAAAAARGAQAIGVEYAEVAVALAQRTLHAHGDPPGARVIHADARAVPLPDGRADLVTLIDVIEHLTVPEQQVAVREAYRLLRPGGRILMYTFPNRLIYDVTYRLLRAIWPGGRRWPADPRNDYERLMHVGEQTAGSLRRRLQEASFTRIAVSHGEMIYPDFVPSERARGMYHRLAAYGPTARFGRADLWAEARRP
jgi:ubiquinone/menaquinone biosynthesis C-methylase UbiE